jgi:hypothetical protein
VAVTFAAYQARGDGPDFSFEGRDEAAGVLGTLRPADAAPVATAGTLEVLEREAKAHLGSESDAILYLADGGGRVHRIMTNVKHHAAVERAARRTAIAVALLVFCATCLLAAPALGGWAQLAFAGAAGVYTLVLRAGLFNALEGAVVCEILLILTLVLGSQLQRVRGVTAEPGAASDRGLLCVYHQGSRLGRGC